MEDNLVCFSQISKYYTKVLSLTSCALMFFFEEKRCVEESDKLIKHISRYILNNLKDSKERSELMLDDIGKYNEHKQIPLEHRNEFIRIVMNLFNGNMLTEAYSSSNEIEKKLKTLEKENFINNLTELPDIVDKVFKHDTLKKYLNSGPTRRMVVIPHKIQKSLKNIRFNLDKQTSVIKFLLQITNHTAKKLSSDKCLKNFRLLWIYFLVAPDKLQQALEEIREESKAEAIKTVRFKE
ncbi:hypothetical protein HHI36_021573 [Cryptolaemus montrouzieri]|uniref:Uncharacterized protein n=1 Tax=Cryptolaemus montrouzieri TaxID=559131 RepID=A0ABD2MXF5_9CUCU